MGRILKKIIDKIRLKFIFMWDGVNNARFTKKYVRFLEKHGVHFEGQPNYICRSVYFDGTGYHLIHIGEQVVLSKEVMLLTHDFSVRTGLMALGEDFEAHKDDHVEKEIRIGNNVFVGARAFLLPGTKIGDNVIIGAGAVVRGEIPSDSIVVGNPAKVVGSLTEWAKRHKDDAIIEKKIF